MGGAGLERVFITGVSPLVLSDVTSGMNAVDNVSLYPELNSLCGFTEQEVAGLLVQLHEEAENPQQAWTPDDTLGMMRDWYNGYRFAVAPSGPERRQGTIETVYNPTLVLYFLKHLQRTGQYPRQMLDTNLAADEGKLDYLAQVASGQDALLHLVRDEKLLEVRELMDRFTLPMLLDRSSQDATFIGSYLFYFGMLTLGEEPPGVTVELALPNEVTRGLYIDRIRKILMPQGSSRTAADSMLFTFQKGGGPEPLLDFVEENLFPLFSNRDSTWANELTVKTLFLSLLWSPGVYITYSEPELEHRYADLCLLRRPDVEASSLWDLLFEFKRVSLKELGMSGEEVKASSREELMVQDKVRGALEDAETQLSVYQKALERRHGDALKLRAYTVVALGFERLVFKSLD